MAPRLIRFEERFIECYSLELSLSSALGSIIHRLGDVSTLLIQTKQLCMHRSWLCAIPKTRRWKFVHTHQMGRGTTAIDLRAHILVGKNSAKVMRQGRAILRSRPAVCATSRVRDSEL